MKAFAFFTLLLSIFFASNNIFAQQKNSIEPSKFGKTPEERFINLRQLGYGAMQTQKFEDAYWYFKVCLEQFELIASVKEKNATGANFAQLNNDFGFICDTLGSYNLRIEHYPKAAEYLRDAIKPYLHANNQKAVFKVQKKLADHYLKEKKFDKAVNRYINLLKLIRINDPEVVTDAYLEVAKIFAGKNDLDSAMSTFQGGFARMKGRKQFTIMYAKIDKFFKQYYQSANEDPAILDFAIQYFTETIQKENDPVLQGQLYLHKAQIELVRGKRGSFFKDITAAIEIFKNESEFTAIARACVLAANTHIAAEEYENSITYLEEAKNAASKIQNNPTLTAEINAKIADAERAARLESAESKSLALDVQMENQRKLYRNVAIGGLLILLIIAIVSFISKQKANRLLHKQNDEINRQKAEIEQQRDNIEQQKNQIESAYQNIRVLSEIGQKITATLDLENVVKLVYDCFCTLVKTDRFGVAVYDENNSLLNFVKFYEGTQTLPITHLKVSSDGTDILSNAIINRREHVLTDAITQRHLPIYPKQNMPANYKDSSSLICLPLLVEQKAVGLLIVESFTPNAYLSKDLVLLRTLASYTSIALENANAYTIIENKNRHITDSIRYAETIQQALLPENQHFTANFKDSFVLFRPKDIVSGDFYWTAYNNKKMIVAVVDCTGHGVPGAFMSMIGNTLLNEAVNIKDITDPPTILQHLHNGVRKALRQTAESGRANDDGMDVCLCAFEKISDDAYKVGFSGAKRPLYYVQKPYLVIDEFKGDSKSIGGVQKEAVRTFSLKEITAFTGDCFFLTTDGFGDQNNIEKVKIGTKQLKEQLLENAHKSMHAQRLHLNEIFDQHSGIAEQRDDVTIVGIKL